MNIPSPPGTSIGSDEAILDQLVALAPSAAASNVADVLERAVALASQITHPLARDLAELSLSAIRNLASGADQGWACTSTPPQIRASLQDKEVLQLVGIIGALHEFCYGFESVEASSQIGWGGSGATRFYINSIYHYVSSLFLVDKSEPSHKRLPMGGTVVVALHPLGLSSLLDPLKSILDRPFGKGFTFGDAILRLRHRYLVHGSFAPGDVEYLVAQTEMRSPTRQLEFRNHMWDLFHQAMILRLKLIATFSAANVDMRAVTVSYLLRAMKQTKT